MNHDGAYLLAGQPTELERLQLQSRVWEPAGHALLATLAPPRPDPRALDLGCGAMGWLRLLDEWVGPDGTVVGSDVDPRMLASARAFVATEALRRVTLVEDDLFQSRLEPASFDMVHARFQIAPLGRAAAQVEIYRRLVRPGGWIVVEDPDMASWRVEPRTPSVERLIGLIEAGFRAGGGDFNAGRALPSLLRGIGSEPAITAHVVALPPGHPYLRLPLQFAASLRPRLEALAGKDELDTLLGDAEAELARPGTWGLTFTLVQVFVQVPRGRAS